MDAKHLRDLKKRKDTWKKNPWRAMRLKDADPISLVPRNGLVLECSLLLKLSKRLKIITYLSGLSPFCQCVTGHPEKDSQSCLNPANVWRVTQIHAFICSIEGLLGAPDPFLSRMGGHSSGLTWQRFVLEDRFIWQCCWAVLVQADVEVEIGLKWWEHLP